MVAAVRDGISVVTSTERLGPDLLVLDIAMPGLNGIAAAACVRKNGSSAKLVFVTNLRDRCVRAGVRSLGQVGFVARIGWSRICCLRFVPFFRAGRSSRRRSRSRWM